MTDDDNAPPPGDRRWPAVAWPGPRGAGPQQAGRWFPGQGNETWLCWCDRILIDNEQLSFSEYSNRSIFISPYFWYMSLFCFYSWVFFHSVDLITFLTLVLYNLLFFSRSASCPTTNRTSLWPHMVSWRGALNAPFLSWCRQLPPTSHHCPSNIKSIDRCLGFKEYPQVVLFLFWHFGQSFQSPRKLWLHTCVWCVCDNKYLKLRV